MNKVEITFNPIHLDVVRETLQLNDVHAFNIVSVQRVEESLTGIRSVITDAAGAVPRVKVEFYCAARDAEAITHVLLDEVSSKGSNPVEAFISEAGRVLRSGSKPVAAANGHSVRSLRDRRFGAG